MFSLNYSVFCIIDEEKTCVAVTLYNLAKGKGVSIGDSVAIPEPYLIQHQFLYLNNVILYNNFIAKNIHLYLYRKFICIYLI
jgi:hypothetical protein